MLYMKIALLEEELAASKASNGPVEPKEIGGPFASALNPTPLKQYMGRMQRIVMLTSEVQSNNNLMLSILRSSAFPRSSGILASPPPQVTVPTRK